MVTLVLQDSNSKIMSSDVFVGTIFKSGTKLLMYIVKELSGREVNTPSMNSGVQDYGSAKAIDFSPNSFFIWHSTLSSQVKRKIERNNVKKIFLVRNIYDLLVSQYFHFFLDVDAETGNATGTVEYFKTMTKSEGIALLINGCLSERFSSQPFGWYLKQIYEYVKYAAETRSYLVEYDALVRYKVQEMRALAAFLGVDVTADRLALLEESSSLSAMKQSRKADYGGKKTKGLHFRKGKPGSHTGDLSEFHYHMIWQSLTVFAPDLTRLCYHINRPGIVQKQH